MCTALRGTIGDGEITFLTHGIYSHWFMDSEFGLADNKKAADALLEWLVHGK